MVETISRQQSKRLRYCFCYLNIKIHIFSPPCNFLYIWGRVMSCLLIFNIPRVTVTNCLSLFWFQSNFFDEYRIEGKDETNNIYLELVPENLTRAMKSAGNAQAVKIKLTKKHTPCLTFEITLVSWDKLIIGLVTLFQMTTYLSVFQLKELVLSSQIKPTQGHHLPDPLS